MPMSTREAVENLCYFAADNTNGRWVDGDRHCESVALLCKYYGLDLGKFFCDVKDGK